MKTKKLIILTFILPCYLAIIFLTDISLVGFWTDIIFSITYSIFALIILRRNKTNQLWLNITLWTSTILSSVIVFGLLAIFIINPFTQDTFKLRSFYYQKVEGRLFNAYFKPVGAYSGGEGNFWITESPKYFPIIEHRIYYKHAILWNFSLDEWDGQVIDQESQVRSYIESEIIDKGK